MRARSNYGRGPSGRVDDGPAEGAERVDAMTAAARVATGEATATATRRAEEEVLPIFESDFITYRLQN